jgi:NADH-quinone oxidoreductase subunit E
MILSDSAIAKVEALRARYPSGRSLLLPSLHIAQKEYGWLSQEIMAAVARHLNLPEAIVRGTATFYFMYSKKPVGRHLIQLCTNVSCMLFGAETLVEHLKKKYNLEPGGTTADGRFSLVIMECIGACDKAPAMLVNDDFHHSLTESNIFSILEGYK